MFTEISRFDEAVVSFAAALDLLRDAADTALPTPDELGAALGPAALVEYVDTSGLLLAVVLAAGRMRLHKLGPVDMVENELAALRFGLGRLAFRVGHPGRLARPPRHVVLSACDSGLPAVQPGDELLGLTAALLALGSRSLVATVVAVPDEESRPMMVRFHRHLLAGLGPAAALAAAQRELASPAAASFVCFGAG
jgi:hypothetical protein